MPDGPEPTRSRSLRAVFVRRGPPHLIDQYSMAEDVLTPMAPLLTLVVFVAVLLSLGDRWAG